MYHFTRTCLSCAVLIIIWFHTYKYTNNSTFYVFWKFALSWNWSSSRCITILHKFPVEFRFWINTGYQFKIHFIGFLFKCILVSCWLIQEKLRVEEARFESASLSTPKVTIQLFVEKQFWISNYDCLGIYLKMFKDCKCVNTFHQGDLSTYCQF